jgi:hypothetical protein
MDDDIWGVRAVVDDPDLPWANFVQKAIGDAAWAYRVGLKNGQTFHCEGVVPVTDGVVRLTAAYPVPPAEDEFFAWGRGIDVLLSEIAWIADRDS